MVAQGDSAKYLDTETHLLGARLDVVELKMLTEHPQ